MDVMFAEPKLFDLEELAQVTRDSLSLLEPYYNENEDMTLSLQTVSTLAGHYTAAIADSIEAARRGYEVAEHALALSDVVDKENASKEEHDNFARLMFKYADEAAQRAKDSLEIFRSVRKDMSDSIDNARKVPDDHQIKADLKKLKKEGIPVFETLLEHVAGFIYWWNWIVLGANCEKLKAEKLAIKYSKIRSKRAIRKWAELKESFFRYTLEVG